MGHLWLSPLTTKLISLIVSVKLKHRGRWGWGIYGLNGWGIYGLNGWGIYDLNGWGIYDLNGCGIYDLNGWGHLWLKCRGG